MIRDKYILRDDTSGFTVYNIEEARLCFLITPKQCKKLCANVQSGMLKEEVAEDVAEFNMGLYTSEKMEEVYDLLNKYSYLKANHKYSLLPAPQH